MQNVSYKFIFFAFRYHQVRIMHQEIAEQIVDKPLELKIFYMDGNVRIGAYGINFFDKRQNLLAVECFVGQQNGKMLFGEQRIRIAHSFFRRD